MYVKSLTLKGFKSFASATTMRLEPGITCIVGPNGSGKSNVVDALAWVMGEQGAKSLRGGKMEDVIFAGTAGRAPLGRAEVALTIDNSDGALPIDYTEVTIARTMFRNGGSEYAINGTSCRLLDVQELLSDSGIGREMHVIVGQGQLDAVLRATPEERRGFIEEAAGVLKHRKRKEKALRKLESMEANLTRVNDLTGEIRRQLGPLGRQAEAARRAAGIQADARDARLRLLADDLVQLTSTLEQEVADESALIAKRTEVEDALTTLRSRLATLEQQAQDAAPELSRAQERWFSLQQLRDQLASTESLASERVRLLSQDSQDEQTTGRDPEELKAQAADARRQEESLLADVREAAQALEAAVSQRAEAEQAYAAEQQRLQRLVRAAADRREGLAKLAGQVGARRSRIEAGEAEIGRLRGIVEQSQERAATAEREFTQLEASVAVDEEGEEGLDSAYEKAAAVLEGIEAEVEELKEAERTAERDRTTSAARLEALELSLSRKDGAATLLAAADSQHGIVGTVASLLQVKGGHEAAIAAALGWAGDALAVESIDHAARALLTLREDDAGRAAFLVGHTATSSDPATWPALDGSAVWARDVVQAPDSVRPAVEQLLDRVALVDDPALAAALVARAEGVTAVTADGDVFAPGFVRGGSSHAPSLIEIQSAVDETRDRVADATRRGEQARFALTSAQERQRAAADEVEAALESLHDSDAKMAAVAERLGHLGATVRAAKAEAERTERSIAAATQALEADRAELAGLSERLDEASAEPTEAQDPSTDERDRLEALASRGRATETELRLTLRTKEERARALKGRAESLEGAARNELAARQRLAARQERRKREATVAEAVRRGAAYAVSLVATTLDTAAHQRALAETARTERDQALAQVRREVSTLQDELRELTDTVHRDEVARTQQRLRVEALQAKAVEELGMDPAVLMEDFGPHQPVPHVPGPDDEPGDLPEPTPFVREVQEKRLRKAERALSALGRVNPLALEEFAALEERHKFLTDQLEDLQQVQARPARHRQGGRRARRARLHRGVPRHGRPVRGSLQPALPRRRGQADPHRPVEHAHHRHRGRGPPARQEDQAALAAVRWRALARGGGAARVDLQGAAEPVLHHGRGRGCARRRQPRPPDHPLRGAARLQPAHRHHPPEAHHGGGRRAVRRVDAR